VNPAQTRRSPGDRRPGLRSATPTKDRLQATSDAELERAVLGALTTPSPRTRLLAAGLEGADFATVPEAVASAVLRFRGPLLYSSWTAERDLTPLVEELRRHDVTEAAAWAQILDGWAQRAWVADPDVCRLKHLSWCRRAAREAAELHHALMAGELVAVGVTLAQLVDSLGVAR
jgi:hypothetical protein